jgi:predicted ATPase
MPMIEKMHIENFKGIASLDIKIGKMTIVTGLNSSGKSTVVQSLRILDRYNHKISPALLPEYGDFGSLLRIATQPLFMRCQRMNRGGTPIESVFSLMLLEGRAMPGILNAEYDSEFPACVYLSAERFGPRNCLPAKNASDVLFTLGEHGEFVYEFVERYGDVLVSQKVAHPQARGETLNYNIEAWLGEITPGVRFRPDATNATNRKHGILTGTYDGFSPLHVGFGLSYVLPVIVAALGITLAYPASRLPVLLVENPEAHLHPQGQTKMGELLALAATQGMQIVVETHSDHFIDGVRLAVKSGKIPAHAVAIHYFRKDKESGTIAETLSVKDNGKIEFWPEGFGDQTMINRALLAKKS